MFMLIIVKKLTVNISKTKIIAFSRGRCPNDRFTYNDELLEIV